MTRSESAVLASFLAVFLMPVVIGCREHRPVFRVQLPAGYKGPVDLACGSTSGDVQTVAVGVDGQGTGVDCTNQAVDLVVMRGGVVVQAEDVDWNRTGDGISTHLSFQVR